MVGTSTASIIAGGVLLQVKGANAETYNGSSWTEVNDLNTGRGGIGGSGGSSATLGFISGGYTSTNVANVENWNGSSWSELADIATGRSAAIATGHTAGIIVGGSPYNAATEEFTIQSSSYIS